MVDNIIPYVESNYRVIADRGHRAIAGFSRGGGESLFTGFSHLETFAWISSYSAYLTPEVCDRYFADLMNNPEATNQKIKLLWLGVGQDDSLYKSATTFMDYVEAKKLKHQTLFTEGGHTWMNARHYLFDTLQLYFK